MNRIGSNSVVPVCALLVALPLADMPLGRGPMNGTRHTVIAASGAGDLPRQLSEAVRGG